MLDSRELTTGAKEIRERMSVYGEVIEIVFFLNFFVFLFYFFKK